MIPNSLGPPSFISRQPSWEYPVELELSQETSIFTARAGIEERQRRRVRSRVEIAWTAALSPSETAERDASAENAHAKAAVVPIWTERTLTTALIDSDAVSIDRSPDDEWFVPGDYAYLVTPAMGGEFRLITAADKVTLTITFASLPGALAFPIGTVIYPCRLCSSRGAEWSQNSKRYAREQYRFSSL